MTTLWAPQGWEILLLLPEADSTFPLGAWSACWRFLSRSTEWSKVLDSVLHPNVFCFLYFYSIFFLLASFGSPAIGMQYTEQHKRMLFFPCFFFFFKVKRAQTWFCFISFFSLNDSLVAIPAGGGGVTKAFDKPTENSTCCKTYFWALRQYCCVLLISL